MGRRFVDGIWIQQRIRLKDARRQLEARWPRQLQPERVPFVDVELVPVRTTCTGPVVDVVLVRKHEVPS